MKTVYCLDCLRVIRHFFTKMESAEDLLGSVCAGCKTAWKEDMDDVRRQLHAEGRENPLVNKARAILHAQGVTT